MRGQRSSRGCIDMAGEFYLRSKGKAGTWYLSFRDLSGVRTEKRILVRTKTEAERLAREFLHSQERLRLGLETAPEQVTLFGAYVQYAKLAAEKASWASEEGRWRNHILQLDENGAPRSEIGKKLLHQVNAHDIDTLLQAKLKEGLAPQTVAHLRNHLRRLFTWAIKKARLLRGENPGSQSEPIELPEPQPRALTDGQLAAVLEAAADPEIRLLLIVAALTGMRKGELLGLRWQVVDEGRGVIHVSKSYGGKTKSKKTRLVPIPPQLRPFFALARNKAKSDYVFPGPDGRMRTKDFDTAGIFRTCLKRAGLVQGWQLVCVKRKGARQGAANHRAKLTAGQVGEVKALAERGERHTDIARRFGVSRRAITFIITGKNWGKPKSPGGCGYETTAPENVVQLCPVCSAPMLARAIPMRFTFKDLRSTFVTRTVEASGNIQGAQLIVGHTSESTTRRHYAVTRIEHLQEVVARVPDLPIFADRLPTASNRKALPADTNHGKPVS